MSTGAFSQFKDALIPLKNMASLLSGGNKVAEQSVHDILDTVETFVNSFDKFIGVFDKNYAGGDFCAGLTFGMQGSVMLEKVALNLFEAHLKQKSYDARSHTSGFDANAGPSDPRKETNSFGL